MNTKRLLCLLIAVLMLVTLFSACAQSDKTPADDKGSTSTSDDKGSNDKGSDDKGTSDDGPAEVEKAPLEWLGSYNANYTNDEIEGFETFQHLMDLVTNTYNVDYVYNCVYQEAYLNTLNGMIAGGNLPDMFNTREILSDQQILQLIAGGSLASLDDVLEYSDGSSKGYYNDPDALLYLKAYATIDDGNWYYVPLPNTTGSSLDFSTDKYNTRADGQIHGAYSVCVRQDWLDKLGLAMPTTTDEFFEVIKKFQDEDANGNGSADERYIGLLGSDFQTSGIGQWFGLPYTDFIEDPSTGEIEVSALTDGYAEFCTYMNKIYNNNLVYVEGTHPWGNGTTIAADVVSAIGMMPGNLQFWNCTDPNGYYMPMPVVQGVEGVEPRLLIQESKAFFIGFSFSSKCDYQAAGSFMDFLCCQDTFMTFKYGIEGKAWDYDENGNFIQYAMANEDELHSAGPASTYWLNNSLFPINGAHHGNLWAPIKNVYDNAQDALDAGEPYAQDNQTVESWRALQGAAGKPVTDTMIAGSEVMLHYLVANPNNYRPTAYYSYTTMATTEEAEVIAMYDTDLKTFLRELTTGLITGSISIDSIDEQVQSAYDNLGLQEYINVMQARVNRFLETLGRPVVEIK